MRNEANNSNVKLIGIRNSDLLFSIAQCYDLQKGVSDLVKQWFKIIDDDPKDFKLNWKKHFKDAKIIFLGYIDNKKGIIKAFKHPEDLFIFNNQKLDRYVEDKLKEKEKEIEDNANKDSGRKVIN